MLSGMGAQTAVEARKYADLAMIEGHGCEALPLCELRQRIHEFDVIFNTVPALILTDDVLEYVQKALHNRPCLKTGRRDFEAAKQPRA